MRLTINIFSILLLLPLFSIGQGVNEARSNFDQFKFKLALEEFQKLNSDNSNGLDYDDAEKLGYCYYITGDTSGIEFINSLVEKKTNEPHLLFWKGSLEKDAGRFEDAISTLTTFQSYNTETDVTQLIESCKLIPTWGQELRTHACMDSMNFSTANSKFKMNGQEFFIFEQELGEESSVLTKEQNAPIVPISKLYIKSESEYNKLSMIDNEDLSIGSLALFPNSDSILFSAVHVSLETDEGNFPQIFSGSLNLENRSISNIQPWINGTDILISYSHPTISVDGKSIVYVQMKHGETSNLMIINKGVDDWSEARLLNEVNTKGNEMFPNYNNDSILTFSSDGLPGYGGLDLFSVRHSNGTFDSSAVHFKDPINSTMDDFQLFWNDSLNGFLTSDRNNGIGNDEIWSVLIDPILAPEIPEGFPEWHAEWHHEKIFFPYKLDTTVLADDFVEGYLRYADYYELEMQIVGYTDKRGTSEANFDLAKRRALWVKSKFENSPIKLSTLTIESKGESTLDEKKQYNEDEHQSHRCVELIISFKNKK
jgi:hypothetical protein